MATTIMWRVIVVVVVFVGGRVDAECPSECSCIGNRINCEYADLVRIPPAGVSNDVAQTESSSESSPEQSPHGGGAEDEDGEDDDRAVHLVAVIQAEAAQVDNATGAEDGTTMEEVLVTTVDCAAGDDDVVAEFEDAEEETT